MIMAAWNIARRALERTPGLATTVSRLMVFDLASVHSRSFSCLRVLLNGERLDLFRCFEYCLHGLDPIHKWDALTSSGVASKKLLQRVVATLAL